MFRCIAFPAFLLLASQSSLLSQSQVDTQKPDLTIRSTTRLIQVHVAVRDGSSQPVAGLAQGDFEIIEDGRRQDIRFFTTASNRQAQDAGIAPGMTSNRLSPGTESRGVTVVLVDSLNTDWSARAAARENLRKFLLAARPDDRIALYTLGGSLKVIHDYTTDAASLLKQLDRTFDQANFGDNLAQLNLLKELIPEAGALLAWSIARETDFRDVQRATASFDALEAIARHVGATPARKSLVWISSGFPLSIRATAANGTTVPGRGFARTGEDRSFSPEFDKAFKALSAGNVAVYPVDPKGLMGLAEFDAVSPRPSADRSWQENNSMLNQLAQRTGGRAFTSQNDILGALQQISAEAQQTYVLAYYAPSEQFDGRYRKIEVRLKRRGLSAAHRQGYYALDDKALKQTDSEQEMRLAARQPLDSAIIGIDARLQPQPGSEAQMLLARIDTAELLWPEGTGFAAEAKVALLQFDAQGRQVAGTVDSVRVPLDAAKAGLLSRNGLAFQRGITLKPETATVRIVVRSAKTGAIGTLALPIQRPTA
ncbi:MAG: VWA domain-containing protein [Acidobacteria bacterium]|nr:VWA domain-containing protein [Acidobacteriota bacterium]